MVLKVRIGVGPIPVAGDDADAGPGLAELIDELEATGVDSVWLSDQVSSSETLDPLIGLAFAAARTSRLKLGTGVLVLPGRNPALVAAQLASLAALAPRRILPAFGLQPARDADRAMYPVPDGRRGAVFDEALVVVRALLSSPSVTHHGEFFHLDDVGVGPLPARPLDLWLGGRLPAGMRRVGRLADGWLGSFLTPDEAAVCRARIEAAARDAGRSIDDDHYGTNLLFLPDGVDDEEASAAVARAARRRPDLSDADLLVSRGWAGTRAEIGRFVDAGVTKFVLRPAVPVTSRREFLDRFADEVMPLQT